MLLSFKILYNFHVFSINYMVLYFVVCRHVALEDFENGVKCYQSALSVDSRHYNAWYGLGMVYLRQEKFEFSEHHFRVAFQINPRSSVIMSYLGTALHALKVNLLLTDFRIAFHV